MLALFHAGGWDELLIALAAFGVLWVAVKLAGRKSADTDEDDEDENAESEQKDEVATPPATPLG